MSDPSTRDRVRLGDVARQVGVSVSTASRALAGDSRISLPTRTAVRKAADDLSYVPNAVASSLRTKTSRTLGLLLVDLSDPVHGQIAAGFEREAGERGYRVVFAAGMVDSVRERRALRTFIEHAADGVALVSSLLEPREARALFAADRLIAIQPDSRTMPRRHDMHKPGVISTDDAAGMAAVVEHLVACGYRDFAYVGDGIRASDAVRHDAAEEALNARGFDGPLRRVLASDGAWRTPDATARIIVERLPGALICYDDKLALALLDALRRLGVRVPEDLGITGFDGIPFAAISNPRLTTVEMPTGELGRLAATSLIASIETGAEPPSLVLPVQLVERESTRPVARSSREEEQDA